MRADHHVRLFLHVKNNICKLNSIVFQHNVKNIGQQMAFEQGMMKRSRTFTLPQVLSVVVPQEECRESLKQSI
jgi:hypothetical protein